MTRDELNQVMARVRAVTEELEIFATYAPYAIVVRCSDDDLEYRFNRDRPEQDDAAASCTITAPRDLLCAALRGEVRLQDLYRRGDLSVGGDAAQALIFSHAVAVACGSSQDVVEFAAH